MGPAVFIVADWELRHQQPSEEPNQTQRFSLSFSIFERSYTRLNYSVLDWYNRACPLHLCGSFPVLTVRLAGSRPVIGAEPGLRLLLAQLQLLGVGEQRPAGVPESLLLPGPALTDVDGHPGGPGGVAAHLRAGLQVTGLELLERTGRRKRITNKWRPCYCYARLYLPKNPKDSGIHYEQLATQIPQFYSGGGLYFCV